jgi:hypothetical protein
MAPHERSEIVEQLENGRAALVAALQGVAEERAKTRPAPERWSMLEITEHVAFVEARFRGMVENSQPGEAAAADAQKEAALMHRVTDRTNRRTAPDAVVPTGKFTCIAEALTAFNAQRDHTVRFAEENAARLRSLSAQHPVLGPLNGVEALMLIAGHGRRHTEQMLEAAEGR